jgi:hypothetical protein
LSDSTLPEVLWHYTDIAAAYSILKTGTLWASAVSHMNDPNELKAMPRILAAESMCVREYLLKDYTPAVSGFDPMKEWLSHMRSLVGNWQRILLPHECFVSSFSGRADSLPMWERYGKVGGVAIGFKTGSLEDTYKLRPEKVQYLKRPIHSDATEIATIENLQYLEPFLTNGNRLNRIWL